MSLRDELNAVLAGFGPEIRFNIPPINDEGMSRFIVKVPAELTVLHDRRLVVDVRLAELDDAFTLSTPVAALKQTPDAGFFEALLRVPADDSAMGRVGLALYDAGDYDVIQAQMHWVLESINSEQFRALYSAFFVGLVSLIDEIADMARQTRYVTPIHPGRGD
ncbi:MAG: hypothetical protein HND48_00615 [Chloroflexi bacterium]|nr:hypothetical protein [Chloroflexota bacterium]